jgi:60S ribosomal subunit assembly/export protein LOC1
MAPSKTRTIKNKHAGPKSSGGGGGKDGKRSATDGVSKSRKPKGTPPSQQVKEKNRAALLKKKKNKVYTEEELGIPTLNKITPVGVVKPPGKKKGKVFVDDRVSFFLLTLLLTLPTTPFADQLILAGEHDDHSLHGPGRDGRTD